MPLQGEKNIRFIRRDGCPAGSCERADGKTGYDLRRHRQDADLPVLKDRLLPASLNERNLKGVYL